jgi:flagellar L-ring protein precursor FlgH
MKKINLTSCLCLPIAAYLAIGTFNLPAQSLWAQGGARSMFSDKRASGKGDVLTIVVQEVTSTAKDNSTATKKKTSMDAAISAFLYSPAGSKLLKHNGQMPALKYGMDNQFSGGGTINNSERMVAQVAVTVIDVLPNGNLVIEGSRETAFSGEKQNIILRGIVRQEDVTSANTVFSYNVADAKIQIIGKGSISDTQRKGWFTKIWDKVTPF